MPLFQPERLLNARDLNLPQHGWLFGADIARIQITLKQLLSFWRTERAGADPIHIQHFHVRDESDLLVFEEACGQISLMGESRFWVVHLLSWQEGLANRLYQRLKSNGPDPRIWVTSPGPSKKFWAHIRENNPAVAWCSFPRPSLDLPLGEVSDILPDQDVFQFQDACVRALRDQGWRLVLSVLKKLRKQGVAPNLILWALTEDLKAALVIQAQKGQELPNYVFKRASVWARCFSGADLSRFFREAAFVDAQMKSREAAWGILVLEHWIQEMAKKCVVSEF